MKNNWIKNNKFKIVVLKNKISKALKISLRLTKTLLAKKKTRKYKIKLAKICKEAGFFDVFIPHKDAGGLLGIDCFNPREIFEKEIEALNKCDVVIADFNGCDVDSGTAWECGYAYAKGIKVIGVHTDMRIFAKEEPVNLMLGESAFIIVNDLETLKNLLITLKDDENESQIGMFWAD